MHSSHPTFRYRLFGLAIDSQIELPELVEDPLQGEPDVAISLGTADDVAGYRLVIEDVAIFVVSGGRQVVIEPQPGVEARNIRLFLLGSAMGALLHQRGLLPLHANAVVSGGRAFAFTGPSGAGKSTLAAWFHDNGHAILADDVCMIVAAGHRSPVAYPGLPRLRLWKDALDASGRSSEDHLESFAFASTADAPKKYDVILAPEALAADAVPLCAIFVLERGDVSSIVRIGGVDVVEAISRNTYRGEYVVEIGDVSAHLAACVAIARTVPVYRWTRTFDRETFDDQARKILGFCEGIPTPIG